MLEELCIFVENKIQKLQKETTLALEVGQNAKEKIAELIETRLDNYKKRDEALNVKIEAGNELLKSSETADVEG